MTEEEAKGLKVGDRVLIEAAVLETIGGETLRLGTSAGATFYHVRRSVHSVLPRPLEVGDRVERIVDYDQLGIMSVLCVHGEKAWLAGKWGPLTVPLKNLRRVSQ